MDFVFGECMIGASAKSFVVGIKQNFLLVANIKKRKIEAFYFVSKEMEEVSCVK